MDNSARHTRLSAFACIALAAAAGFFSNSVYGQDAAPKSAAAPSGAAPSAATPPTPAPPTAPAPATDSAAPAAGTATDAGAGLGEGGLQDLLNKGDAAIKAGDFTAAIAAFNEAGRVAEQTPGLDGLRGRSFALIGRGRAYVGLKNYAAAMKDFDAVILDDPTNVAALIARGQARVEVDRIEDALNDFKKAVDLDFTNPAAMFGYGKVLTMLGRSDEAILPLTTVITADPKNAEAYRYRGLAYSSLFKNKQALEDLHHAIELNPDDYEAYFSLGIVNVRHQDYQSAVDSFGKAIEHYKAKPGQEDQPFFQGNLNRSAAYVELGKTLKTEAEQKAAYQGAYDESQKIVSQLEAKNPTHAKVLSAALLSRGIAERMLGQLGTAVRTLSQAIDLRTNSAPDDQTDSFLNDAYFRRGICFHLIGEEKMAISDFQSSAHLLLNDPRANLWEGMTYAKLGDYHEALRAYGDAIAASDRYTLAYYNRALTYMTLGDYKKAVGDFNDAIRLDPANAEYYFKRGVAYEQLGENQKASESFAAAIEFDKAHANAYRHMASAQERLNHPDLANQYREKADQLAPQKKSQ